MASNDKKTPASNNQINADQNAVFTSLADQTLLKALQNFIVPLIRVVDRKEKNDNDQLALGPEAGKLIKALQEFVSGIIGSCQCGTINTVEVNLVEDKNTAQANLNDDDGNDDFNDVRDNSSSKLKGNLLLVTPSEPEVRTDNLPEGNERPLPTFHDKLLKALREHVFNTMPIRLLCFQSNGSSLKISLLERGVIHSRLESALRAKIHEVDHVPVANPFSTTMETEEEAIERLISRYARYAILSHTWLRTAPGEVTYSDWNKGLFDAKDHGYQKLVNFCKTAWKNHGLTFGWMDTVCINKESSAELDESIRSMYSWYGRAYLCMVYLAETGTVSNMHMDPWFTRGWTLQELLAPSFTLKFYNGDWKQLAEQMYNDRTHAKITKQIKRATTISEDELYDIHNSPISRRMQLAANREVTREEDMAYSLMGIFDVSISTAYGEGADRAFFRLLQEILISSENILDLFNWAGKLPDSRPHNSLILPPSPQYYLCRSSKDNLLLMRPMEPLTLTHLGLRITVILMPAVSISSTVTHHDAIGDFKSTVDISPVGFYHDFPTSYHVLDNRISGPDGQRKNKNWYQITLAVFNFDGNEISVCIPKTCVAVGLRCYETAGNVTALGYIDTIETNEPIVFDLIKVDTIEGSNSNQDTSNDDEGATDEDDDDSITDWNKDTYYRVNRSELTKNRMQLISLYL